MKKIINIQEVLPSTITSRKAVELINCEIPLVGHSSVIFDFTNIDFISRAFADELIHFIADKGITADFRNANAIITEMLMVVSKNKGKRNSTFHHIAVTPFTNQNDFNKFLSMI